MPRLARICRAPAARRGAALLAALLALLGALARPTAQAAPAGGPYTASLPLVVSPGGGPDQPPPGQGGRGALFLDGAAKHNSADVAVDSAGGMHAAYAEYLPSAEHPRAVYTWCAAGPDACASRASWQSVALADDVREVQLALTPEGRPRLLIVAGAANLGRDHIYAACDAGCASPDAWTLTRLVTTYNASDVLDTDEPQRSFAIAPDGRVGYLYRNRDYFYAEPDLYGLYYTTCAADCADPASWESVGLSIVYRGFLSFDYEVMNYPSLAYTADGRPRFVAQVFALNEDGTDAEDGLYYYSCDAACGDRASWGRAWVIPTGGGSTPFPTWSLKLDSAGRPRVALFLGDAINPPEAINRLIFLSCDASCLDRQSWSDSFVMQTAGVGKYADLALDAQGRPRLAWVDSVGDLGYSWCDSACTASPASWRSQVVETEEELRRENPQAIPLSCDADVWSGLAPALALDPAGNPRIAYDVSVDARCYYTDPTRPNDPPTYRFEPIWRGAHLTYFPQP